MYLQPWQVFALGCVIGTLISFIILSTIILRIVGRAGVRQMQTQQASQPQHDLGLDLISKLCFILLARKVIDEVDNDFMLDKVAFNDWKNHIDELINKEDVDCGDNRDQQRNTQEDNNM